MEPLTKDEMQHKEGDDSFQTSKKNFIKYASQYRLETTSLSVLCIFQSSLWSGSLDTNRGNKQEIRKLPKVVLPPKASNFLCQSWNE